MRLALERHRIVPPRRARAIRLARLFKKHADRRRTARKRRHDPRSEPVARARADHEHALRRTGDRTFSSHVVRLLPHMRRTALGMRCDADEPTNLRLDDHTATVREPRAGRRGIFRSCRRKAAGTLDCGLAIADCGLEKRPASGGKVVPRFSVQERTTTACGRFHIRARSLNHRGLAG